MGILIASSSQVVYGSVIWDPIEHLGRFLDGNPGHATRFGVAMIALCFVYVQLILNLSANSCVAYPESHPSQSLREAYNIAILFGDTASVQGVT